METLEQQRQQGEQQQQGQDQQQQSQQAQETQTQQQQFQQSVETTQWSQIHEQGTYVELTTGDLYRVPQEAISGGGTVLISKVSNSNSRFVRVSQNAYLPLVTAREICADANILPNF